jgi:ankyrin repeat protein
MARDLQRELVKKARMGVIDGEKGTRALAKEVKKVVGGVEGLDYNEDPPYCRTAVFEACWRNNEAIVKDLMNQGAQIDLPDAQGRTPLHEAAAYGHLSLVQLLLENKAAIDHRDKWGQTPLFRAVQAVSDDQVTIMEAAEQVKFHELGATPLFRTVKGGVPQDTRLEVAMYLISQGANTNITDVDGCTIQHLACFNGDPELSWWLFNQKAYKNRFLREDLPPPHTAKKTESKEAPAAEA